MSTEETQVGGKGARIARFLGGLILGLIAAPASVALLILASIVVFGGDGGQINPYAAFELKVVGEDVSRAGGTSLLVDRSGDRLQQRCHGICDDLKMTKNMGGQLEALNVRGRGQVCILCRDDISRGVQTWSLEGEQRLSLVRGGEE